MLDESSGAYDPRVEIQGEGRPLVCVPGIDGTGLLFHRQLPGLSASYRVATYRLQDGAGSMGRLVDDLGQVVDRVAGGDAPVTLVGESFGGTLSLSFALARPDRVERLVIINSFPHLSGQLRLWLGYHGLRVMPWGAMEVARRLTAFRLHSRHTHRREVRRFFELTRATTKGGYLGRLAILRGYDVREQLHAVAAPTLFLASDLDHLVPSVEEARFMAARVPDATVRILDGHGHICLIAPGVDLAEILDQWGAA